MTSKKVVTIDDSILAQPLAAQTILNNIRSLVKKLAPNAEEKISYGIPTFKLKKNLVHFASFPNHIGFYPKPSGMTAFQNKLRDYKKGKGSVQFDQPIPYPLIPIEEIVKFRIKEEPK